jgi:hypothetical protein
MICLLFFPILLFLNDRCDKIDWTMTLGWNASEILISFLDPTCMLYC